MLKKSRNKFIVFLTVLFLFACIGALFFNNTLNASATDDTDTDYDYSIKTDENGEEYVSLTNYKGTITSTITIPYSFTAQGVQYEVREIGEDCFTADQTKGNTERKNITTVIIPDTVTTIGQAAFYACSGITSITFGSNLQTIGDYAFYSCKGLTSITLPASLSAIGHYAFYECSNLANVTFEFTSGTSGWFYTSTEGASSGTKIDVTSTDKYATYLRSTYSTYYWYCPSVLEYTGYSTYYTVSQGSYRGSTVVIPDTYNGKPVTKVDNFKNNTYITKVVMGDNITEIKDRAFENCENLASVTIGSNVTTIGQEAFAYCEKLTSITIPASVTYIGYNAFTGCLKMNSVVFEKTNGWNCYWTEDEEEDSQNLEASELGDTDTAAKYLAINDKYKKYKWTRTASGDEDPPVVNFYTGSGGTGTKITAAYYNSGCYFYVVEDTVIARIVCPN